jgi:hypothetical protein
MAKRRTSGDPSAKQGVLICLGICIPLIIILGVATYFGFSGKSEAEAKAATAGQDKDKAQKDATKQHSEAALLKAYVGLPLDKNDEPYPATFHDDPQAASIIKELDQDPGWDPVKRAPKDTYKSRVTKLTADIDAAYKVRDTTINEKNKLKAELDAANDKYAKMDAKYRQDVEELNKKKEEDREKIAAELAKANRTNNELRDEIEETKKKAEFQRGDLQAANAKLTKEKKTLDQKIEVIGQKIAPVYLPDFEKPKGKIDAIDPESRFAYINVGASDNVKPLLTFSVYSPGPEGRADLYRAEGSQAQREKKRAAHEPVPKGTLEVVSIIGPHSSKARITNVREPGRDPLMRGDLIFNPVWSPNQHMHVAVTGMINLTGDGRDRSAEFIQTLQRMGVIVDSYLDTKDLKIKGPGMTVNTNYLVEGEHPDVNNLLTLGGSTIGERSTKIDELINKMKNDAKDLGISTMTARNFMTLAGYRIPKQITPFAGASGYGTIGGGTGESKEETPKEKPKPKAKEMEEGKAKDADKEKAPEKKDDADKEKAKEKEADKEKAKEADKDKEAPKEKEK